MKKIKQHLEEAFQLASSIPVKGDAVDLMAVVRANLKNAYRLLDEKEAELTKEGKDDGEEVHE